MPVELTAEQLRSLHPFKDIQSPQVINDVLHRGVAEEYPEGTILFKRDQVDGSLHWLISGSIDLLDNNFDVTNLKTDHPDARRAIDDQSPHSITAITTANAVVFRLKRSVLDLINKLAESGHYMVTNIQEAEESDSDWMSAMLTSPLFDFLPPANIQTLFSRFEEVECNAGDVVIKQGEVGDYFYVVKKGYTKVEYNTGSKSTLLAELGPGAFFGEDALISNVPRNATITMTTEGALMRLSEDDFQNLLHQPVMEKLDLQQAIEMMEAADPLTWILDVRTRHEYQAGVFENSINIPILNIRRDFGKLDNEAIYVVRSGGDKRADLAAYILLENGFNAYVLDEPRGGS